MKLVVGLGNPGERYLNTRHNLGWWVLDELACALRIEGEYERWGGLVAEKDEVTLFKPLTYMNESGRAVAKLASESGVSGRDILVVLDDLHLPLGTLRVRAEGTSAGHRGLQSVIDWLGSDGFPRMRLGIGRGALEVSARDFVLSPFEEEELPIAGRMVERGVLAAQCWAREGVETAMSRYNGKVEGTDDEAGRA